MKKKLFFAVAFAVLFVSLLYVPREAPAVPAFARQTGMACNTCHFQHFPALNAFGRAFKAGGYTMIGGESMVEGDLLSLPSTLNATLVTKIRYQNRNGTDTYPLDVASLNGGELQFPDEGAILIGGRAGEHIGFLLEAQLADPDAPAFASFKLPVVYDIYDTKVSVIPFSTDAGGASYGFELLNTGALRMHRILEHRGDTSAQQYIGTAEAATGFALVGYQSLWYVNYSPWMPVAGTTQAGPFLHYARAAVTPTISGWDVGAGVQWWGGTTKYFDDTVTVRESASAFALDAQAQGAVMDYPVGVYLTYANASASDFTNTSSEYRGNVFNQSTYADESAWTILAEAGVLPNRLTVAAGYRAGMDGDPDNDGAESDNATTIAGVYNLAQNFQLQLNHTFYSGDEKPSDGEGDQLTTLMLFAAF
jgi:hypothetical protein